MSISETQTAAQLFVSAEAMSKKGQVLDAKRIFENILTLNLSEDVESPQQLHYDSLVNLSTICLQLNSLQEATEFLYKAIKLDSQRFEAFYNLAMVKFYQGTNFMQSIECLKYCLSLMYLKLGFLTNSLKLINKSISLNDKNVKTYIHRALYYENNQKYRLAENQFERITYESEEYELSNAVLADVYLQKTLFFRRIGDAEKIQENYTLHLKHKEDSLREVQTFPELIQSLLTSDQDDEDLSPNELAELQKKMVEMVTEASDLMEQLSEEKIKVSQKQKQNLTISSPKKYSSPIAEPKTNKSTQLSQRIESKKEEVFNFEPPEEESLLENDPEIPFQNSISQKDEHPSISINDDEDSVILNKKIEELQRQIKESGGNVPEIKDLSRNSDQENFLEFQIEKTIEEINNQKKEESKVPQMVEKLQSPGVSNISDSKINSNGDIRDSVSIRSKITEVCEIELEDMKNYKSFVLELRSVTMFEEKGPRKDSYGKVKYFNREFTTEKCKTEKMTWNHVFEEMKIRQHSLEEYEDDDTKYEVGVEVFAKEGGWLSWNSETMIAFGTIKLREKGLTKCTLEKDNKKVGMLYYKVKLERNEN